MEKGFLIIVFILLIFGLAMLSSAGIIDAQKKFNSSSYYVLHQFISGVLPGLILMFILSRINYKNWKKLSVLILLGTLFIMGLVFVPGIGFGLKGATRWIRIAGNTFQPSELLKLSLIIYFAAWFSNRADHSKDWFFGMAPFLTVMLIAGALLVKQPDFGTLIIVTCIGLGIYFFHGESLKKMALIVGCIAVVGAGLIYFEPYRFDRIRTFIDPSHDPRGISYQINQSLISIGSGGMFGVGYGMSTQKYGFLPEVVNDSIFAVIAEELGFTGSAFVIAMFAGLCYILVGIAKSTDNSFGYLFVMGMNIWIMSQATINIAAISGLLPLTGIPLPFISFGGSAMMSLLAGLGIVWNISRA
jgi:cell division protein FtsW